MLDLLKLGSAAVGVRRIRDSELTEVMSGDWIEALCIVQLAAKNSDDRASGGSLLNERGSRHPVANHDPRRRSDDLEALQRSEVLD
jgi:hypothetical protein